MFANTLSITDVSNISYEEKSIYYHAIRAIQMILMQCVKSAIIVLIEMGDTIWIQRMR